jgi:pimeloyl-ACP methyl ester carboxylesterase
LLSWAEAQHGGDAQRIVARVKGPVGIAARTRGLLIVPMLGLALVALPGCQSSMPLPPRAEASAGLDQNLAASIAQVARAGEKPRALARAEADHRRLLAANLQPLLNAATPPRPAAGVTQEAALRDPADFSAMTPVLRPTGQDTGLRHAGIGLPVVAQLPAPQDPNAPRAGYQLPATLVAQPQQEPRSLGRMPTLSAAASNPSPRAAPDSARAAGAARPGRLEAALVDPTAVAQVPTASGTLPVAMDLAAPLDATRATGSGPLAAVANLLRPGRFTGEPRIVFLQPFEPDKTPLVLVHGLLSTPGIWRPLVTQLLADPRIRDCCQLWFFYYPTGQPVPLSALQLREALNDAVAETGLNQQMILIGHSMGGILSRTQVSRIGPTRAETILPGVSELAEYNRVRRALTFEPRTDVSRVVFLFVPHRGSRLAANSAGTLVIRLIRLPDTLLNETEHALNQLAGAESRRLPTSIHGLSPRSRFLRVLDATEPTVPVHSIIGNRGRGDGTRGSDGVVPIHSARVPAAESELVVPTGHGGFDHPKAVEELKRIILLDVAERRAANDSAGQSPRVSTK